MKHLLFTLLLFSSAYATAREPIGCFLAYPKTADPFFTQGIPRPFHYYVGQDLMLLHDDGSEEVLVKGHQPEKGLLAVHDVSLSLDKTFVLYAHIRTFADSAREGMSYCDIFKIDLATRVITQLTDSRHETIPPVGSNAWAKHDTREHFLAVTPAHSEPREIFTSTWNTAPIEVTDGQIVFTSTRDQIRTVKDSVGAFAMYRMDADGSNVERIDFFSLGGVMHPTRCADGSLLFSVGATQGLRSGFVWTIWKFNPDGTAWEPVISHTGFAADYNGVGVGDVTPWHGQTQLSNRAIVALKYYNTRTSHGSLFEIPEFKSTPFGPPTQFGPPLWSDNPRLPDGETSQGPGGIQLGFQPRGMFSLAPWATSQDATAFVNGDPSQTVPDLGFPAAGLSNSLYVTATEDRRATGDRKSWGIYKIADATKPVAAYTDMLPVVDKPDRHEWYFIPLLAHEEIYGSAFPKKVGNVATELPAGSPYCLFGTSSVDQAEITNQIHPNNGPAKLLTYNEPAYMRVLYFNPTTNFNSSSPNGFQPIEEGNETPPTQVANYEGFRTLTNERIGFYEKLIPVQHYRTPEGKLYSGTNPPAGSTRIMRADGRPDTSWRAYLPADQSFAFQLLDADLQAIYGATSQVWRQGRPGERRDNCAGCHNHWKPDQTPIESTVAGSSEYQPLKLDRVKFVEYFRDVRPILDQHGIDYGPRPHTKVRAYHSQVVGEDDDQQFTEEQKHTLRAWFDTGSLMAGKHADGTPIKPEHGVGPFADTTPPTLTVQFFGDRVTVGACDPHSGLNEASLSVTCSVPVGGRAANTNLADLFTKAGDVWTLLTTPAGTWTVSIRDKQVATNSAGVQVSESGNLTCVVKTVKEVAPPPPPPPPPPTPSGAKAVYVGLDGDYVGPARQNTPDGKLDHHIVMTDVPAGIKRWNVHAGATKWSNEAEIPIVQVRPFPPSPLGIFDLRFAPQGTEAVTEFRVFILLADNTELEIVTTLPVAGDDSALRKRIADLEAEVAALRSQLASLQVSDAAKADKIVELETKIQQLQAKLEQIRSIATP